MQKDFGSDDVHGCGRAADGVISALRSVPATSALPERERVLTLDSDDPWPPKSVPAMCVPRGTPKSIQADRIARSRSHQLEEELAPAGHAVVSRARDGMEGDTSA